MEDLRDVKVTKKYYDPEYDKEVTEDYIRKQYNWFKEHGDCDNYEKFKSENFDEVSESNTPFYGIGLGL